MTPKNFFSNCSLFVMTIVTVIVCSFVLSVSADNFASVNEILVPGQSSVFDVHFEDPKQQQRDSTGRTLGSGGKGQYDTSLAFSVPLFSYTMPGYRENPSSTDLLGQAAIALGSLGLLATVAYIPFYIGLDGSTVVGRSGGPLETMAGLADSWSRAIGLDECGQMAICDAHANYRDYGILALPIVLMFPGSIADSEKPSVWQEAAMLGKSRQECHTRYSCLLNPMWIAKFLMTTFVY